MKRILAVAAILVALSGLGVTEASAAQAIGIPGVDVCKKDAPFPAMPGAGLPGLVGERPLHVTNTTDPAHIWSTGGFAGLQSHPYDLGCALDPTSYSSVVSANADSKFGNGISGVAQAGTSLTDALDRRAWQPQYVFAFLKAFADRTVDVAQARIVVPLIGAGILIASIMILLQRWRGDTVGAAQDAGWILLVLGVSAGIVLTPLILATTGQKVGSAAVGLLNDAPNASDGSTDAIVESVHYQAWLRRAFGDADTDTATTYGPALLASQRFTWTERDTAERLKGDARGAYLKGLVEKKSDAFKEVAGKVQESDPVAYRHLTGAESGSTVTLLEVLFAAAAGLFRLAVDVLVVICTLMLCVIPLLWLIATPYLVSPKGQQFGRELGDNVVRAVVYVGEAALAAWLFGIAMQVALQPGTSGWWSLLLLTASASIAWIMLAPFHKASAIISLGHMNGSGWLMGLAKTAAVAYVTGRIAGGAAADKVAEKEEEQPPVVPPGPGPLPTAPPVVASIYTPDAVFDPKVETHFTPNPDAGLPTSPTPGLPSTPYVRPAGGAPTVPPPDASTAAEEPLYTRTDDNEGADL